MYMEDSVMRWWLPSHFSTVFDTLPYCVIACYLQPKVGTFGRFAWRSWREFERDQMKHMFISKHYSIIALIETLRIPSGFFRYCQPIMYIASLAAVEVCCFWMCEDFGPGTMKVLKCHDSWRVNRNSLRTLGWNFGINMNQRFRTHHQEGMS